MSKNSFLHIYRDLYDDVVNQVLLMNLVARQIWFEDEAARECFEKIHNGYIALTSEENLRQKIGKKTFDNLFPDYGEEADLSVPNNDKEADRSFLGTLGKRYGMNNTLNVFLRSSMNSLGSSSVALENEQIFEHVAISNILKDVFEILDNGNQFPIFYVGLLNSWQIYFINTLFEGVKCIENTYGYSYQNLYMCIYHFDLIYKYLIPNFLENAQTDKKEEEGALEVKKISDDKKRDMLHAVATWIRRTTRIYKCNFSRNEKMFFRVFLDKSSANPQKGGFSPDNPQTNAASTLTIFFNDDKPERLIAESTWEDFSAYSDEICKMLKFWLCDQWMSKHKGSFINNSILQKEYDEYKSDIEKEVIVEIKKQTKIFTKKDSISTFCYAILAWNYCEGIMAEKSTQDDAVMYIEKSCDTISNKKFPTAGVKKQLGVFDSRFKTKGYSQIRIKQVDALQQQLKSDREFFPYPLFGFSTIPTDEHIEVADVEKSLDAIETGLTRP